MNLAPTKLIFLFTFLAACDAKHLYVAHDTVLGVNAKVNEGRQQGQLVIGYDRDFATVVPTSVDNADNDQRDAMSLVHCTQLQIDGIHLNRYSDFTATGAAAQGLAGSDSRFDVIKDCGAENDLENSTES